MTTLFGNENGAIAAEKVHVHRERSFFINGDRAGAVLKALAQIEREGSTGQIILDVSQGTVCTIRFQERQPVPSAK
jgi:hypothetical protein